MSAESLRGTDTRAKVTQTTDAYGPNLPRRWVGATGVHGPVP